MKNTMSIHSALDADIHRSQSAVSRRYKKLQERHHTASAPVVKPFVECPSCGKIWPYDGHAADVCCGGCSHNFYVPPDAMVRRLLERARAKRPAEAAKPTKTKDMNTTQSPTELAAVPCSAFDAAMALISLGPQRSANAVEWCRVSLEMCKHCKGTENVNEAAARIVAERMKTYDRKLRLLTKEQHRMRDPERTLLCDIIANGQLLPDPNGSRYGHNDPDQATASEKLNQHDK